MFTRIEHEVPRTLEDRTPWRGPGDGDAASSSELEETFVSQFAERTQDRVGIDTKNGGDVTAGWKALARFRFAFGNCSPDFGSNLLVEVEWVMPVDLDRLHGASHTSVMDRLRSLQ